MINPIVYAIPVFLALIAAEAVVARVRGRPLRLNDGITSLNLGALSQVTGVFGKLAMIGIYVWSYGHFRLATLPGDALWVWASGLLLYDFLYYWHHRLGHEVGVLWAAHVVHHQSEEYNLTTALRQTSSDFLFGWIFFLPMAVLGFPPTVYVVVGLIDLLYQFWIHTEQVGRLGVLDRLFATPSNHRVHHAVNDRYLDKNYGGLLILWDRLFGSFIEEDEGDRPVYGTRAPLRSFDPLWANLDTYAALARDCWQAASWRDRLKVWLKHPGWRPADVAARYPKTAFELAGLRKYDPPATLALRIYCGLQYLALILPLVHFLIVVDALPWWSALAYGAWLSLAFFSLGALLETRPRAFGFQALSLLIALAALAMAWPSALLWPRLIAGVWLALSLALLPSLWRAPATATT